MDGATGATPDLPTLATPAYLAEEIKEIFSQVVGELPPGLAKAPDTRLIIQLAEALYIQMESWKKIVSEGLLTEDRAHGGEWRRHPAVLNWRQAADTARQCMNLLGMSPASRARIQIADGLQQDSFEEFLNRRHADMPSQA